MNPENSTIQPGNIKQDIQTILTAFYTICQRFGKGMPEKFYEKQMKKMIPTIKAQPTYRIEPAKKTFCRPDSRLNDIIIEYKSRHHHLEKYLIKKTKYLKHCNCASVVILDFEKVQFYHYF